CGSHSRDLQIQGRAGDGLNACRRVGAPEARSDNTCIAHDPVVTTILGTFSGMRPRPDVVNVGRLDLDGTRSTSAAPRTSANATGIGSGWWSCGKESRIEAM